MEYAVNVVGTPAFSVSVIVTLQAGPFDVVCGCTGFGVTDGTTSEPEAGNCNVTAAVPAEALKTASPP